MQLIRNNLSDDDFLIIITKSKSNLGAFFADSSKYRYCSFLVGCWKTQPAGGVTTHFPTLSNHQSNGSFDE